MARRARPTATPALDYAAWKALARDGTAPDDVTLWSGTLGGFVRKSLDLNARTVEVVISTGVEDRSNDILDPNGWDLDEYKQNPVVLADHYHCLEGIVGKALQIGVVGNQLRALDQFASYDENPFADTCFKLVAGGYARGVSPGFRYLEWTYDTEAQGIRSTKQRLFEHSIVVLPDNQEALVAAKSAGIDMVPMRSWMERLLDGWSDARAAIMPKATAELVYKALGGATVQVPDAVEKGVCLHAQTTMWVDDPPTMGDGMQATAAMPPEDDLMMEDDDMKALAQALADHTAALKENTAAQAATVETQKALLAKLEEKAAPTDVQTPDPATAATDATKAAAVDATKPQGASVTAPDGEKAKPAEPSDEEFDLDGLDAKGATDLSALIGAEIASALKTELGAALTTLTGRLPD